MPVMGPKSLHESELKDILTTLADIKDGVFFDRQNKSDRLSQSSISRASKDLIMSFPVLCEDTIEPSTASMICKAIERKAITMFQILFSANQMKASGGVELLKKWHNNVATDFNLIDNYMDAMDMLGEGKIFKNKIEEMRFRQQITEATSAIVLESKRPGAVYSSSIFETSLNEYRVYNQYGKLSVVAEAKRKRVRDDNFNSASKNIGDSLSNTDTKGLKPPKSSKTDPSASGNTRQSGSNNNQWSRDKSKGTKASDANAKGKSKSVEPGFGYSDNNIKDTTDYFNKQLLNSDVKKANELVPSLMIVRFMVDDPDNPSLQPVERQFVAGVKARLIPIDSYDLFDRIESKNRDKAGLVQFVRATTKEISFVKDYLLAIDQAKMDAIKTSKNKTNGVFKTLEKRATKSVFNRLIGKGNDAGCITTIVMSQTSVDYMKKEYNIKMDDPRVAMKIMDAYNLLCFVIADESVEVAKFLFDGDDLFEQVSFNSLEREAGDGSYKKMINLLSKMNR